MLWLAPLVLAGCHFDLDGKIGHGTKGSGTVTSESRSLGTFTKLESNGVGEFKIKISSPQSVKVTTDDNLHKEIKTRVENGRLIVESDDVSPTKLEITITVASLDELELNGAASVNVEGLAANKFRVESNGAASVALKGKAETVELEVNGAGSIEAGELAAKKGETAIAGAGSIEVNASETLKARVDGVGSISYVGDPKIDSEINGVGSISRKS